MNTFLTLFIILLISPISLHASGTYKRTRTPHIETFIEAPRPKEQKELEKFMLNRKRRKVTLNKIVVIGSMFEITGNYQNEENLKDFIEGLRNVYKADTDFDVKTSVTRFAGIKTYHYKIKGKNLW